MICNRIAQQPQVLYGATFGCRHSQPTEKNVSINSNNRINNNAYTNNFNYVTYNRTTNIYNTYIDKDNASLSINNNITVNNYNHDNTYNVYNNMYNTYNSNTYVNKPQVQKQQSCIGKSRVYSNWGQRCYQPVRTICSGIANKVRNFMGNRLFGY